MSAMERSAALVSSTAVLYRRDNLFAAWPSLARMEDGRLVAVFSGDRKYHVDPYGKTLLVESFDQGTTWSEPRVITDTPLDDRDAGIVQTAAGTWLVSFFTSRMFADWQQEARRHYGERAVEEWQPFIDRLTPEICAAALGAFVRRSTDRGHFWGELIRTPVSSPHGPVRGSGGRLLYLGNGRIDGRDVIGFSSSEDDGLTWRLQAVVCPIDLYDHVRFHEPHLIELPDGRLLGLLRANARREEDRLLYQTESSDSGRTWSQPAATAIWGLPPHLCLHSSGRLVATYGHRRPPYGQRAAVSGDLGRSWQAELELATVDYEKWQKSCAVGLDEKPADHTIYYQLPDLGYPATVELADGSLYTVYYQSRPGGTHADILGVRWHLPG